MDWYHYGARMYDPSIGRFTGVDPLAHTMPAWGGYTYGFNNPIRFIDPTGMAPESPDWIDDGNGNLIAELGDNATTLQSFVSESYDVNISAETAQGIIDNAANWNDGTSENVNFVSSGGTVATGDFLRASEISTGTQSLNFDGSALSLVDERLNGQLIEVDSWDAISGPWGAGALPNGVYTADNLRERTNFRMSVDGVGFSMDLNDAWDANAGRMRTELRIHPDGNTRGTLGCVGLTCDGAGQTRFYNSMNNYLNGATVPNAGNNRTSIQLHVQDRTPSN